MTEPSHETSAPSVRKSLSFFRAFVHAGSFLLFAAAVVPALGIASLYAPGPLTEPKNIVIAHGSSAAEIGAQLAKENAVYTSFVFRLAARATGALQAGEYALPARVNALGIAKIMHEGRSVVRLFTAAEGLTSAEIVHLLTDDPTLSGTIEDLPAEGSLLPETYRYSYGDSRASILARMQKAMQEKTGALWETRESGLPLKSADEAVILASLVEKETGKADERARIAGVFYNRLQQNMRLQSDPTVIYALTNGRKSLDRALTHDDLFFASPINTYASDGLPPRAICNPGAAALDAVLHPEHHMYLYFVANGTGGHAFAADLAAHNKNINMWHQMSGNGAPRP